MKKLLFCVLALVLAFSVFACTSDDNGDNQNETGAINIYIPDGAPALAIAKLMHDDAKIGDRDVNYIVVNPANIRTYLVGENADFAIAPTNVAANVYNTEIGYKLAATVTHGNLYIVGKTAVTGESMTEKLEMLKGKKIGVIGQNAVPDMTIRYILNEYDLTEDVTLSYYGDGALAIAALKTGQVDFALLGEPAATNSLGKIDGSSVAFDLGDIWADITDDRLYPQAGLVAKDSMDIELVNELVQKMKDSEDWAEKNPELALTAISDHMLEGTATTITNLSAAIIANCNIKIISSGDAKTAVETYLDAIKSVSAAAIGGKLPDADFYL